MHAQNSTFAAILGLVIISPSAFVGPAEASVRPASSPTVEQVTTVIAAPGTASAPIGATARRRPGRLHVRLEQMPAGLHAAVRVTGPKQYRTTVRATRTLRRLQPGRYRIMPLKIAKPGGTVSVRCSAKTVKVRKGATSRVKVTYRWLRTAKPPAPAPAPAPAPPGTTAGTDEPGPTPSEPAPSPPPSPIPGGSSDSAVHGAPLDGAAELWWIPPLGTNVSDYVVEYSSDGKSWHRAMDEVSAEPSAVVIGLRNGTEYVFRVSSGNGAFSVPSAGVVPKPVTCSTPGPHANLTGCDFSAGLNLVDLTGANLAQANLSGSRLQKLAGANLRRAHLRDSDLVAADLTGANVSDAVLGQSDLTGAKARGTSMRRLGFTEAPLTGANLSDADLTGAAFARVGVGAEGIAFQRSILVGARFSDFSGPSDMTDADLSTARFENGIGPLNLTRAKLVNADFSYAGFGNSHIQDAVFTGASLTRLTSAGGFTGVPKALPADWTLREGFLLGPTMILRGDARGKDFRGVNLSGADLGWVGSRAGFAQLSGVDFSGANLSGVMGEGLAMDNATLVGANLGSAVLTRLDLTGANLARAHLQNAQIDADVFGADLTRADLSNADVNLLITGADFTDAILTGVFGRVSGTPKALPGPWTIRGGFLLGPTARIQHADLSGLDLSGVDLTNGSLTWVNMDGTDLRRTILTGIRSEHVTGVPLLPPGWLLVNGVLVLLP